MNLVLIGYRGTGKSTVAALLGARLGMDVVSLDQEIVREAGRSIPEIVAAHGWPHFRDLEAAVTQRVAARDHLVIGGGTDRPALTAGKTFTEEVEDVRRERTPLYEAAAHHQIDTDTANPREIADTIVRLYRP